MDFASTTPVDKKVQKIMRQFLSKDFYNPSAIYRSGEKIKDVIEYYRIKIAKDLQVKSSEIFFTNGGTESNNIAVLGVFRKFKNLKPHIITTAVEHPAVLDAVKQIEKEGGEITVLNVDENGRVSVEDIKNSLKDNTVLVSVVYSTNEIGTIMPISKISREILKYKESIGRKKTEYPYFHTDASQAGLLLDLNINGLKVDMMSLDGSKIYGPKGSGCLIKRHYVEIEPIFFGGGQEHGIRPGTENVSAIVGFSEALLDTFKRKESDNLKFKILQDYFLNELKLKIPEAEINGSLKFRISNNINVCVPELNSEFAVIQMDEKGVNCTAMTACKALRGAGQSYAIEALGKKKCAGSSLRFTFGRMTTKSDIDKTIKVLKEVVDFQLKR